MDDITEAPVPRVTARTNEDVKKATVRLREFSFLSQLKSADRSQVYEMHKMVQEATRYSLSREGRQSRELWGECEKYLTHAQRVSESAELCGGKVDASTLLS
jgi:hypothetical protein